MKPMYYVKYRLKQAACNETSGPFEERKTAEAFVIAFVNRVQVEWITIEATPEE